MAFLAVVGLIGRDDSQIDLDNVRGMAQCSEIEWTHDAVVILYRIPGSSPEQPHVDLPRPNCFFSLDHSRDVSLFSPI